MGIIQNVGQKVGGVLQKVRTYLGGKISDPIQRDNYGSGTTVGGITVHTTPSTDSGTSTPTYSGGGGRGGRHPTTGVMQPGTGGTVQPITTQLTPPPIAPAPLPPPPTTSQLLTPSQINALKRFDQQRLHTKEIYRPGTGTYQRPTYGYGAGGTATQRYPSPAERDRIKAAIEKERVLKEKFKGGVQKVVEKAKPIIDTKIISTPNILDPYIPTYGELSSYVKEGIEWELGAVEEMWTDVYGEALLKSIPVKSWPGKWVGGEYETKPKKGTKAWEDAIISGKVIPTTPKQVGKTVAGAVRLGAYATPVGTSILGVEAVSGVQAVVHPEAEARKILTNQYEEYSRQYVEAKRTLQKGYELPPKITQSEFIKEYAPEVIQQVKTEGVLIAAASLAFLGGIGAFKAVKFAKTPVITKTPVRKVAEPFYIGTEETVIKAGKEIKVRKFEVFGETRPPIEVIETTRGRELFGMKPKKEPYIIPAKTYKQYTPFEVIGEQPFPVIEVAKGRRYGTVYQVRGEGIPTDLKTLEGLTKTRQFEWQKLAEKITGKPTSLENVPKVLKENVAKVESYIESEKLFRLFPEKAGLIKVTTPWKSGKTITRVEAVSTIEPVIKTDLIKVSDVKTVFKDVTFPGARAAGETPAMKGFILEPRKPTILAEETATKFIIPTGAKKTPSQVILQEQVIKQLPTPPQPKRITPKSTRTVLETPSSQTVIPLMAGGTKFVPRADYSSFLYGDVSTKYLGVGEYEVTQTPAVLIPSVIKTSLVPGLKVTPRVDVTIKPRIDLISTPKVITKLESRLELKPVQELGLEQVPRVLQVPVQVPRVLQVSRQVPRVLQVPRQAQEVRVELVQVLRPSQIQRPRQVPRERIIPIIKILPRIRPPKKVITPVKLRKPVPEVGYTFEIRRKGKWERTKLPFAYATKKGAEYMARKKVLKEAAASYKVVKAKAGKKVVRSRMKAGSKDYLFRPGKEEGVMVQKKLLRILTPGEKKEISYAGGLARMKKTQPGFYKQPIKKVKKKKKVVKKTKGRKKK